MVINNLTQKTLIASNGKYVTTLAEMVFGLHWLSNPPCLLFKTRFGIHTFLLKKPIDIVILNDQFKVIELKENLKPNQFFFWNPKFQWVLELPTGLIAKTKTMVGQQLNFDPKPKN